MYNNNILNGVEMLDTTLVFPACKPKVEGRDNGCGDFCPDNDPLENKQMLLKRVRSKNGGHQTGKMRMRQKDSGDPLPVVFIQSLELGTDGYERKGSGSTSFAHPHLIHRTESTCSLRSDPVKELSRVLW